MYVMKRKLIDGTEQDVIKARRFYAPDRATVRWVKRKVHKRERREGRKQARKDASED